MGKVTKENKFNPFVLTVYAKIDKYEEDVAPESKLFSEAFSIFQKPEIIGEKKHYEKLTKFIHNAITFMTQKDIVFKKHEYNEKNAERRKERGLMPIPEHYTVKVTGKLEIFVDKFNEALSKGHRLPTHSWRVPKHNVYFWNKVVYRRLYAMSDEDLEKNHYFKNEQGFIYRERKGSVRGEGVIVEKIHKVVDD